MEEPSESEIRTAKEIGVAPEQFHEWMEIHMKHMHDVIMEMVKKNRERPDYRAHFSK